MSVGKFLNNSPRVVIIGGGFGGLYAAKSFGHYPEITLIDRENYHLFQPLLYQVATGGLSPGDIASPLRAVLKKHKNIRVVRDEVIDIDPASHMVVARGADYAYDYLVISTGVQNHYFGNEKWVDFAPSLKTIEDAIKIRSRVLRVFETAEQEPDRDKRTDLMNIAVVGGGPTGVELAGALAELSHTTMKDDFSVIDPRNTHILLLEAADRLLTTFPARLSRKAEKFLSDLDVTINLKTRVTDIGDGFIITEIDGQSTRMNVGAIFWTAGVKASPISAILQNKTGAPLDKLGRVMVERDMSVPGHPEIFVIGDLANFSHQTGSPLPGIAPVAMQQGRYLAGLIKCRIEGGSCPPFHYRNKGILAVIGRNAAVADFGFVRISGFVAWLTWIFVHIWYLIEFDNKALVLLQWAWDYFTRKRGARLITTND